MQHHLKLNNFSKIGRNDLDFFFLKNLEGLIYQVIYKKKGKKLPLVGKKMKGHFFNFFLSKPVMII